jgi:hypothetical protein
MPPEVPRHRAINKIHQAAKAGKSFPPKSRDFELSVTIKSRFRIKEWEAGGSKEGRSETKLFTFALSFQSFVYI